MSYLTDLENLHNMDVHKSTGISDVSDLELLTLNDEFMIEEALPEYAVNETTEEVIEYHTPTDIAEDNEFYEEDWLLNF